MAHLIFPFKMTDLRMVEERKLKIAEARFLIIKQTALFWFLIAVNPAVFHHQIFSVSIDQVNNKDLILQIFKDIYTDPTIAPFLALKGGAAAQMLYGLNRYTLDLDFDLLDLSQKKYVLDQVKKILEKYGMVEMYYNHIIDIASFLVSLPDKVHKLVQINCFKYGARYEIKSCLGIPIKVMLKEDMAAQKTIALVAHTDPAKINRDIFDVYFFLKNNWPINKESILKRTGRSFNDHIKLCIAGVQAVKKDSILIGLEDLLDATCIRWVQDKLCAETIVLLQEKIEAEKVRNIY